MSRKSQKRKSPFARRHGLSLVIAGILALWIVLYCISDEQKHWGSFFGNAIADWTGVLVTVLATKHLYEKGSRESKKEPRPKLTSRPIEFLREHSLTIFLVITGGGWVAPSLTPIHRPSGDR